MKVTAVLITRDKVWPAQTRIDPKQFDEVLIRTECPNILTRFQLAAQACNEVVYVQDDDCEVPVADLKRAYDGRLTNAITMGLHQIYSGTNVTLIGWGCFFPRSMAQAFLERDHYWRQMFGDEVFETEADRFFTFDNRPHNTRIMGIKEFRHRDCMSNRPNHYRTRDSIIAHLRTL